MIRSANPFEHISRSDQSPYDDPDAFMHYEMSERMNDEEIDLSQPQAKQAKRRHQY